MRRLGVRRLGLREPLAGILAHLEESMQIRVPAHLLLFLIMVLFLIVTVLIIVAILIVLIIRLVWPNIKHFHIILIMVAIAALLRTLEHFEAIELIRERQEVFQLDLVPFEVLVEVGEAGSGGGRIDIVIVAVSRRGLT